MTKPTQNGPRFNAEGATRLEPGAEPAARAHEGSAGADLGGRLDQFGSLLAKGLDLAGAGVSLGVTILSRVGAAAQQQLRERMDDAWTTPAAPVPGQGPPAGTWPADAPPAPAAPLSPEAAYAITNRLPLLPGGPVQISFSINNDSMTEPKKVALQVEDFTGDAHGARINANVFAVKPAQKTIAPVDFEKFFITGRLPAEAPPDVYRGWIVVASDTELRIPVVLVAMPL